jgi:O-antigen ligase
MNNKYFKLHWIVFLVMVATPLLLLVARKTGNLCFYAFLILAAVAAISGQRPQDTKFTQLLKKYWPLHLAMAGMLLAIFINQAALSNFTIKTYDYPSRMAFFPVILWVALLVPYRLMRQLQWAYVGGALLAAIKMYLITDGGATRGYVDFMPIIEFGQLALLLGFFSVLSIDYEKRCGVIGVLSILVKFLAGCAGIYAAYLSQTRGAWIGIPLFIVITFAVLAKGTHIRKQLTVIIVLLLAITATFSATDLVQNRVSEAQNDIHQYFSKENPNTSVGVRLQLWKGSWRIYSEHPLFGVGREKFVDALGDLEQRGMITHEARVQPHSHNEILYNMSTLGTVGLLGILGLYLVPGLYFMREVRDSDKEIRATACMGVILCLGFLILGLSDVMFMWGVSDNFYSMIAAFLFAAIINRKKMLSDNSARPPNRADDGLKNLAGDPKIMIWK